MQMRPRFRSFSLRNLRWAGVGVFTALLIGLAWPRSPRADDTPPSPSPPERIGEEIDIFRDRKQEENRKARKEAQKKPKKAKAPDTIANMFTMTPTPTTDVTDGFGMISRVGYLAGPSLGRPNSIAPAEIMPYILSDEHFFFGDVRGFITNNSQFGGNAGIGYRHLREDLNAWGGISLWYDADQSTSKLFQEVGISFEGLIQRFELRSNVYIPVSSSQNISNTVGNASVVGNQLLYGRVINVGTALAGVDAEIGYSLPIRDRHVARAFVGGYHFEANSGSVSDVNGVKVRVEGVVNNGITVQGLYTNDNLYGSNVMVGVSMQFPFGNNHPTSGWKQHTPSPFRYVERDYNVIVAQRTDTSSNQVATDPTTGKAYVVEQVFVSPTAPGGGPTFVQPGTPDGTTNHPFTSIAAAQAAGGDIILVQSGSVVSENVTLTAGQHLFGLGSYTPTVAVGGGGAVQLPNLVQAGYQGSQTTNPIFANTATMNSGGAPAVTLASNTEVAGFAFSGTAGGGIASNNASGIYLHDLTFNSTTGDSIHLTNPSGDVTLRNIQINGGLANGVVIDGGTANIAYFGAGNSITTQGIGLELMNMTGGTIGVSNLNLKNNGGAGLELNKVGTDVTIQSLTATKTTGPAVIITGNTGTVSNVNGVATNVFNTYNFTGFTTISQPNGAGFTVNSTDAIINVGNLNVSSTAAAPAVSLINNASSAISFGSLTLNTNGGTALSAVGLEMLNITGGTITTVNAPAVDISNSTINTNFSQISVDGGSFGISLAQSTGLFNVVGNGSAGSGGTIENTTTGVLINSFGKATLSWMNFTTNGTAIQSKLSTELDLFGLQINGSTGYAISSLDDSLITLRNSVLASNGSTIGAGTILVRADAVGTFSSAFLSNTITDTNGTAIQYTTTPSGTGASLAAAIASNTIAGYHGTSPIIGATWNGPASLQITSNTLYAFGSNMTAVSLQDPSTSSTLAASINSNSMTFEPGAAQGTGIFISEGLSGTTSVGTSQLTIGGNSIDFKAAGGTGMHFALFGTSADNIFSNLVTDEVGGATGMLFDTVAANSSLGINGNVINLLATDLTTHQGIIFTSVSPTIQLSGSVNNLIYNTTSIQSTFSIPVNSAVGGFYINNQLQ